MRNTRLIGWQLCATVTWLLSSQYGKCFWHSGPADPESARETKASTCSFSHCWSPTPVEKSLRTTDSSVGVNKLRISSRCQAEETCSPYYGYRFYNPSTGRWLTRDPAEESGGANVYAFAANHAPMSVDPLGLCVGTVKVAGWKPVVENGFFIKKRGWLVMFYWIPPTDGEWAGPCGCKPCQKAIWIQDVNIGHRGWRKDWGDDESNQYGADWNCVDYGVGAAQLVDEPSIKGPLWMLDIDASPYIFRARSSVKCVKGRDAGKIYQTVEWGFTWEYDGTPQGVGPVWCQYEIAGM